jgi:hypothetical protein
MDILSVEWRDIALKKLAGNSQRIGDTKTEHTGGIAGHLVVDKGKRN